MSEHFQRASRKASTGFTWIRWRLCLKSERLDFPPCFRFPRTIFFQFSRKCNLISLLSPLRSRLLLPISVSHLLLYPFPNYFLPISWFDRFHLIFFIFFPFHRFSLSHLLCHAFISINPNEFSYPSFFLALFPFSIIRFKECS